MVTPNGASVYAIDDIGDVDETLLDEEKTKTWYPRRLVFDMEKFYACIFCKKRNINAGECGKM